MQLAAALQSLDGGDLLVRAVADRGNAGPGCPAVDEDRAGAAATLTAAVFTPGEIEIVPQDAEQAPGRIGVCAVPRSVDVQFSDGSHRSPSRTGGRSGRSSP